MGYEWFAEGTLVFPAPHPDALDPVVRAVQRFNNRDGDTAAHQVDAPDSELAAMLDGSPFSSGDTEAVQRDPKTGIVTAQLYGSWKPSIVEALVDDLAAVGAAGSCIYQGEEYGDGGQLWFGPYTAPWRNNYPTGKPSPAPAAPCRCPGFAESLRPVPDSADCGVTVAHTGDCPHGQPRRYRWRGYDDSPASLARYAGWWRAAVESGAREPDSPGQVHTATDHRIVTVTEFPTGRYTLSVGDEWTTLTL